MDAASAELAEAGRRQAEIDRLIDECKTKLAALHHKHSVAGGGRGSGRWKKSDQSAKDALEGNLKLLQSGVLPSERRAAAERARAESVQASALLNAAHHAASQPPPSGRPATNAAGSGGTAGGGATAGHASEDDVPDHDDGEEEDALRKANYYTVSAQQKVCVSYIYI